METLKSLNLPADQGYKWYYEYLLKHYKKLTFDQINELMDIVIDKLIPLNECYYIWSIAKNVPIESVIRKLEDAIIQKDSIGKYCYQFAKDVSNADIQKLQDAVIQKDKDGYLCYLFAKYVPNADIQKLQDAVIKKDPTGRYCLWFIQDISGVNIQKLQNAVTQKDKDGLYCYMFAKYVPEADIKNL